MSTDRSPETAEPEPATVQQVDLAALYQNYHDRLRRHAMRTLPSNLQHEAGTALANVFTRIMSKRAIGGMEEPENWEAYLVTAVTNACRDIVKTAQSTEEIDDSDPRTHRSAEPDPTGDAVADRLDHTAQVDLARAALKTLDERSRAIVIGKHYFDQTNRDLGKELGLTGQRVGQLYGKAIKQLREEAARNP